MAGGLERRALFFTGARRVQVQREVLPSPAAGQVLVETGMSAISPGTELLIYRGQAPADLPADEGIAALPGRLTFPLRYGYAAVGRVAALGSGVPAAWQDRRVFAFQPHASHFLASPEELLPLPETISTEDSVLLPNVETAVNLLHDGRPLVGEQVAVFGQGVVGLLTTALLARIPLARLVTLDLHPLRRRASLDLGAYDALDPATPDVLDRLQSRLRGLGDYMGADLVFELSGAPQALDLAIRAAGFNARILIGSWYGVKRADLDLGGRFHRSRLRLISSQVSSIDPELTGRWSKARRMQVAVDLLAQIRPSRWITHRFPIADAARAYELLDHRPEEAIQVVFTYPDSEG